MTVYVFERAGAVNSAKLDTDVRAINPVTIAGLVAENGEVRVITTADLSAGEQQSVQTVITNHNPALTAAQQEEADREAAKVALEAGIVYLQKQLAGVAVPDPAVIVATIKPIVDSNPVLQRAMTRQAATMNSAYGWSLTLNPTTPQTRNQYILAVEALIPVFV